MPESTPPSTGRRWYWPAMGVVLAVGLVLRWWRLGADSLWFDEAYAAWAAGLSPERVVEVVRVDNSPPLYYLLLHAWTQLYGESEWALRAPSAVAVTASMLLIVIVARRVLADRLAEVAAVLLFAVAWLPNRYAHEARGYAVMELCGAIAAMGLTDPRRWRGGLLLVVGLSGMTWVHNMAWLYVIGFAAAAVIWPARVSAMRRIGRAAAIVAVVVVLYLPWLTALLAQVRVMGGGFWIPRPDAQSLAYMLVLTAGAKIATVASLLKHMTGSTQPGLLIAQFLASAAMLVLIISACRTDQARRARSAALAVAAVLPLAMAYAVSVIGASSVFTPKALVVSAALVPVVLATAMTGQRNRAARAWTGAAMGVMVVLSVASVIGQFVVERKEDWRSLHAHLASLPPASRLLVFVGNDGVLGLEYYERRTGKRIAGDRVGAPKNFHDLDPPRAMQRVRAERDVTVIAAALDQRRYESVVLVATHIGWSDPGGLVRSLLRARLNFQESRPFDGVVVERYAPGGSIASPAR